MRWSAVLAPLLLAACAGSAHSIPQSHIDGAHESIGAAEQQGVTSVPDAVSRLNRAKQELTWADQLSAQGQKRSADLMYLRADADARVASAVARSELATSETQRIDQEATQIQKQARECAQQSGGK